MFTSEKKTKNFIYSSRIVLRRVGERLSCYSKFQGFANLLPQHESVEIKAAMYVAWCEQLIIHINRNWTIKDPSYPVDCVDAIKAVLTCYAKGQVPNADKWLNLLK